jgi:hypothetical protein
MRRLAFAAFISLAVSTAVFAQAAKKSAAPATPKKDATPATAPAPAPVSEELMRARMKPPVKGTAAIEFLASPVKIVSGEVQSVIKVKNVDTAPIVGLKIDEYFYSSGKEVSACTARVRNPIAAGEIADVPISCPNPKEKVNGSNLMFTHANGKVKPTQVKSFDAKPATATKKK